jgi:cytochrome c oxidase assembly protein subunit 15
VVSLGAWVRLSDAGLGCPDWPGCYGQLVGVPDEAHEIHAAEHRFGKPVEAPKAWKEMIHRYAAGLLGLASPALAVLAWRQRARRSPWLEVLLLAVVAVRPCWACSPSRGCSNRSSSPATCSAA